MKKFLLTLTIVFSFNSQAAIWCDLYDGALDYGTEVIANTLNCKNLEQIRTDIELPLSGFNFCQDDKGDMNKILCPLISKYTVEVVENTIPESWSCEPTVAMATLEDFITRECIKILPL